MQSIVSIMLWTGIVAGYNIEAICETQIVTRVGPKTVPWRLTHYNNYMEEEEFEPKVTENHLLVGEMRHKSQL